MRTFQALLVCTYSVACGTTPPAGSPAQSPVHVLATDDGLELRFDTRTARFESWRVPGWPTSMGDAANGSSEASATTSAGAGAQEPTIGRPAGLGFSLADHQGVSLLAVERVPVSDMQRAHGSLRLTRDAPEHGLRLVETWTARPRHIEVEATIVATGGAPGADPAASNGPRSRAIEACLQVPVDAQGKRWHHHLEQSEAIAGDQTYQTLLTPSVDIGHYAARGYSSHLKTRLPINLHGLNAIADDQSGLAVAMDPAAPATYFTAYHDDRKELRVCFHLGLHAGHRTSPGRTSARILLFAIDEPAWGLRSALAEYVQVQAPWFRGKQPRATGMTVGGGYRLDQHPVPEDFHIDAMWNAFRPRNRSLGVANLAYAWPTGYLERSMRLEARPVSGPCADCDRSIDAHIATCLALYRDYERGALRFPEICQVGWAARDCRPDDRAPTPPTYGPVRIRHSFYDLLPRQAVAPNDKVLRLLGRFDVHGPLSASLLRASDGRHEGALSDSHSIMRSGQSGLYTCYINGLNPDPGVLVKDPGPSRIRDDGRAVTANFGHLNLEIARRATGGAGDAHVYRNRSGAVVFDGIALDTVGAYLRPDFHEQMIEVASHPLSYDPDSGRVVAMEHLGLTAFMTRLRAALPERASIATNGYPISGTLGQGVDRFVRELGRRLRKEPGDPKARYYYELYDEDTDLRLRRVHRLRMVAHQRPITFWARFLHTEKHARERGVSPEQALLQDMQRLLPLYTANGIYAYLQRTGIPGRDRFFGGPPEPAILAEYQRHLDTVQALTSAGWQPLPHARASDPGVKIERFGEARGRNLITVYNSSERPLTAEVTVDWPKLGLSRPPTRVRDFNTAESLEVAADRGSVSVPLTAHAVRVLSLDASP